MGGERLSSIISVLAGGSFLVLSLYIYSALVRQIGTRTAEGVVATKRKFGMPEAAVALALAALFALNSLSAGAPEMARLRTKDLVANGVFALGLVIGIAIFLKLRRFNIPQLAGFQRLTFQRAFATGFILLIVAYPLIILADWMTARILGSGSTRQGIIELFAGSRSFEQRVLVIILAVMIAPMVEEFVFRFFLYGVLRRYAGRTLGLIISALLFAAVHAHLPSFGPLFVLGSCFTIAYEWSGSLLVPMTLHALFNALTLTALAFPQFQQ
ncbi:MAG: CPBP family intramembrane metalloprotease [Chthoniobacterales bacterium]|nr:CPBP family intramembrane metalloprotease [Chthoniobacterales bacterium]